MQLPWRRHDAEQMIRDDLVQRGIRSTSVLNAMRSVPREEFVLPHDTRLAYADAALPIECNQTISQPYIVALVTEALELSGIEHVLEVGTGSGYQTAILCELAGSVVSIERHEELSRRAAERLKQLEYANVKLFVGDGSKGYSSEAPFDRILVTAAASELPPALFSQLRENGILVAPIGPAESQVLWVVRRRNGRQVVSHLCPCRFVPLILGPKDHQDSCQ